MSAGWRPWALLGGAIVGGALVQGVTAIPGYSGLGGALFVLAVLGSVAALVLEAIALPWAASAIGRGEPLGRLRGSLVAWGALIALVVLVFATLAPLALPVVWTIALVVLPSAAPGRWNPLTALRPFRHRPWAASAAVLVMLLVGIVSAIVALATGLFLTGFLGGLVAWAWIGVVGTALLLWWSRLLQPQVASPVER